MNRDFQQCMAEATRLTRSGDVAAATALLQRAWREHAGGPAPHDDPARTVDVECREVFPDRDGGTGPQPLARLQPLQPTAASPVSARHEGHTGSGPAALRFELFSPPQAAAGRPLPLIVMLHGCTQSAGDFARGTGMNDLACEQGFHVLYPEQSRQAHPQGCWNWFKPSHRQRGRGEAGTLAAMIRQAVAAHRMDGSRIYLAGLSAGGAMAAAFAAAYPDLVAALGVHSGLAAGVAKDVGTALGAMKGQIEGPPQVLQTPTIVFHGDADATVHPRNGDAVFASVLPGVGRVESGRVEARHGRAVTRHRRIAVDGRVVAEHWVLHGTGHAWSGGHPSGSHTDPLGVSASAEMVRFFAGHRLDGPVP